MERDDVPTIGTDSTGPLERALDLLSCLSAAPISLAALSRAAGLPKSTAHRLLAILQRRTLVERDDEGRYRLGMGLVALGLSALETEPLVLASRPVLAEESRSLGETLFVVAARGGDLVVLAKAEGSGVLRAAPTLGARVPVHATAAGRLYLAFAPAEVTLPNAPFPAYAEKTPTTLAQLEARVARTRSRGFDVNVGEWVPGLAVVSAPIRTSDGGLAGVLALAAAVPRFEALGGPALAPRVVEAAARIGARLEGRNVPEEHRRVPTRVKGTKR